MVNERGVQRWTMSGRTVLITGAGSGIGAATAAALGAAGATVLVHARTDAAAERAATRLRSDAGGRYLPVAGDLGSLAGVRQLADRVREHTPTGLDVLVNNAGAAFARRALSPDGIERTIAVNHVAVAALTAELTGLLQAGASASGRPSRVVNLSSVVEKRGKPVEDWTYSRGYSQFQAYSDSKLLSLAHTYALSRHLSGTGVVVNAADPGSVATGFGTRSGGFLRTIMALGRPFMASPQKGARTSIRLAADPDLDDATGGFYRAATASNSSAQSSDRSFAESVYTRTLALIEGARR